MTRVPVARLTGVFGIRGELKCRANETAANAVAENRTFAVALPDGERSVRCRSVRRHHDRLLIAFEGIDTPEAARAFVGASLLAERDDVPLGPGEYFDADLIGLRLIDECGRELARVVAVEHYPAQDCLVVEPGRALVPLVKAFVRDIDVAAGTILTSLPEGLLT